MRKANEIGSGSGACARQGRGVRRRSAPFRSCSSLGFGLLEENRRGGPALRAFMSMCLSGQPALEVRLAASSKRDGNEWALVVNAVPIAAAVKMSAHARSRVTPHKILLQFSELVFVALVCQICAAARRPSHELLRSSLRSLLYE